ncbi:MAG: hypothetical protein ACHBN1_08705 [Heteroscytonema crispum UTEX LB 1556]
MKADTHQVNWEWFLFLYVVAILLSVVVWMIGNGFIFGFIPNSDLVFATLSASGSAFGFNLVVLFQLIPAASNKS